MQGVKHKYNAKVLGKSKNIKKLIPYKRVHNPFVGDFPIYLDVFVLLSGFAFHVFYNAQKGIYLPILCGQHLPNKTFRQRVIIAVDFAIYIVAVDNVVLYYIAVKRIDYYYFVMVPVAHNVNA